MHEKLLSRRTFTSIAGGLLGWAFTSGTRSGKSALAYWLAEANVHRDPDSWPLFRGDTLSTGSSSSTLPQQLDMLWKFTVEDGAFEATPAIVDGTCYIGDFDGAVYAIDLNTGKERWKTPWSAFRLKSKTASSG